MRSSRSGSRAVRSCAATTSASAPASSTGRPQRGASGRSAPAGGSSGRCTEATATPARSPSTSSVRCLSTLASKRALHLAALHGNGLRRVGATRAQLIDSAPDQYPALSAWGQALHDCPAGPDGIVWRSRHYDDAYALLLFAGRVARRDLEVIETPLPLAFGRGLERVTELAEEAGITLVR
jgi:hypothetical protein